MQLIPSAVHSEQPCSATAQSSQNCPLWKYPTLQSSFSEFMEWSEIIGTDGGISYELMSLEFLEPAC